MSKYLVKLTSYDDIDKGLVYVDTKILVEQYNLLVKPKKKAKSAYDLIRETWNVSKRDAIVIVDYKKKDAYYPINNCQFTSKINLREKKIFVKMSLVHKQCSLAYDAINNNFYIIRDDIPQEYVPLEEKPSVNESDDTTIDNDDYSVNSDTSTEDSYDSFVSEMQFNGKLIRVYRNASQTQYHFNAYDISELVNRPSFIYTHMSSNQSHFCLGEDYINVDYRTTLVKYFTPHGALRCISSARNIDSSFRINLRNWVIHVGYDQEIPLPDRTSELLFNTILNQNVSGLYLLDLGRLEDIDASIGIDKNAHDCTKRLYKFGYSNNIKRRIAEHANDYGKYGCTPELKYILQIDESMLQPAETRLKHLLESKCCRIDCGTKRQELLIDNSMDQIRNCMLQIGNEFRMPSIDENIIEFKHKLAAANSNLEFMKNMYETQKTQLELDHSKQLEDIKNRYEMEIQKLYSIIRQNNGYLHRNS